MWTVVLNGAAKKEDRQRDVRRTFKMLREVWLNIGVEKVDTHEDVMVKVLLDSSATGMFMDKKMAAKHGFRLQKLERPVAVRNVNGTNNSGEAIIHQVEVNMYYKSHIERMKMDVCDLGKTDVILGMPWLQAHNLEINWEIGEVKITRCSPLCGRNTKLEKGQEVKKGKRVVILEEEKMVRWAIEDKENWGRNEEVEADHKKIEEMVPKRFLKWRKVFGKMESEGMPTRKIWDHAIDLKETFKPQKGRIYSLSKNKREEVQNFVNDQLRKGYIRPSKSPQTSPVFFVGKKDGSKRMVMDYRNLNDQTVKNNYPLLLITDLIDNMGSKQVFTKIDLWWGFNNIRIKEGDEWKGVFTTHVGSFELIVMFFGMTNLPATFQAMMNEILRDMINEGKVAAFVDNVLVGTETEEGHDEIVEEVLRRLEKNNLYIKPEKCAWKVRKIGFLGVVIGPGGIEMEKEKVDGVLSWPKPKNMKDVRKFLGLTNYYRRFIKDFAQVARPMNMLTRKDMKWQWGEEQQKAFDKLKRIFTTKPVLAVLDLDKEFRIEADASNYATRGVLSMKSPDELWRPVVFIFKSLSDTERNYEIHDKEMLVVVRCLEAWRHFLEGTMTRFEIWTDHKNLEYFMKAQKLNRRQARWALYLLRFNFMLKHVPGSKIEKTDSLSRRPDWKVEVERDNEDETLVKPKWLEVRRTERVEIIVEGVDLLEKVKKLKVKDDEVVKAVEEMK